MKNKIAVFFLIAGLLCVIGAVGGAEKEILGYQEFGWSIFIGLETMLFGTVLAGQK